LRTAFVLLGSNREGADSIHPIAQKGSLLGYS